MPTSSCRAIAPPTTSARSVAMTTSSAGPPTPPGRDGRTRRCTAPATSDGRDRHLRGQVLHQNGSQVRQHHDPQQQVPEPRPGRGVRPHIARVDIGHSGHEGRAEKRQRPPRRTVPPRRASAPWLPTCNAPHRPTVSEHPTPMSGCPPSEQPVPVPAHFGLVVPACEADRDPGPRRACQLPRNAASSVAMSGLVIVIIARKTRSRAAVSVLVNHSWIDSGTTCHDRPYRSVSHPHTPGRPPWDSASHHKSSVA